MYARAALRDGATPEDIQEVLLHTAIYAGIPAAGSAFTIVQETLSASVDATSEDQSGQDSNPRHEG